METYLIFEIVDADCDNDGLLSATFRLDTDPEEKFRNLKSDEYYYYAEDLCKEDDTYIIKEWGDEEDGEGHYSDHFDFREWKEYQHSEDMVKQFIYEYYPEKNDLPDLGDE